MIDRARSIVADYIREGNAVREIFFQTQADKLREVSLRAASCLARGGKILFCGDGTAAACAQHLAATFVYRCSLERPALPALALSDNSATLTAISDNLDFRHIFARQIEALGRPGDMVMGISYANDSANVIVAMKTARRIGLTTVGFVRPDGDIAMHCDTVCAMPDADTVLLQEIQFTAGQVFCRLTEYYLFENTIALLP